MTDFIVSIILIIFIKKVLCGIKLSKITINYKKCENIDCAECVDICPMEILLLKNNKIFIQNETECSQCDACIDVCPNECITLNY